MMPNPTIEEPGSFEMAISDCQAGLAALSRLYGDVAHLEKAASYECDTDKLSRIESAFLEHPAMLPLPAIFVGAKLMVKEIAVRALPAKRRELAEQIRTVARRFKTTDFFVPNQIKDFVVANPSHHLPGDIIDVIENAVQKLR